MDSELIEGYSANMFNLGFSELVLLAIIALVFIGPKQLPEVAKTVARLLNEFRRATGDIVGTVRDVGEKATREVRRSQDTVMEKMQKSHSHPVDSGIEQNFISDDHQYEHENTPENGNGYLHEAYHDEHEHYEVDEKTNSGFDVDAQEYIDTEVTTVNFDIEKAGKRRKTDS